MNKLRKWLLLIIIIFLVIIILVALLLINYNKDSKTPSLGAEGEVIDFENEKTKKVTDRVRFFTVKNCISKYLDVINKSSYEGTNLTEEQIKNNIISLLSQEYTDTYNINKNNLYDYIYNVNEKLIFLPIKMNYLMAENIEKYVVEGDILDLEYNYIRRIYIIVNLDYTNYTFSIEQILNNYDNIEQIELNNNNIRIEKNSINSYSNAKITNEFMCKQYIEFYKYMSLSNPNYIYNYLDNQYKEKRFGSEQEFNKYIMKNRSEIETLLLNEYSINMYNDYKEYICKDKYDNYYIFKETAPMEFTLTLDTYTIESETFKQEYEQANEQTKVLMNIDKWIDMLNNRDYKTAYSVLDETFRNNNFGSEEKFEEYMREKFPGHYKLNYGNYEKQGQNNVQEVVLTQIVEDEVGSVSTSVVMKLLEGTNFVMSFNII